MGLCSGLHGLDTVFYTRVSHKSYPLLKATWASKEHTAPVNAICFTPQGNAVLSASRDGSVRAFDLLRYRNFRTFASPDGLCQFSSVAVDSGGEIVAASATGGKYAVYVWSIQTGNILEVLTGHTSHVEALHFSPSAVHPGQLVSASWDGTPAYLLVDLCFL